MDFDVAKDEFLSHIEIGLGRSLKTVENYNRYLTCFAGVMRITHTHQITEPVVHQFRLNLNRKGDIKKTTQNYYLIAIACF